MNVIKAALDSDSLREPCRNAPASQNRAAAQRSDRLDTLIAPESCPAVGCNASRAIPSNPSIAPYPKELAARELAARRATLILSHTALVSRIASHLFGRRRYVDIEDLIRAGRMGLLAAIREFGHEKAEAFGPRASLRIREAMLEFVRESDWSLRCLRGPLQRIENETESYSAAG